MQVREASSGRFIRRAERIRNLAHGAL
jgi:hypothetical protein